MTGAPSSRSSKRLGSPFQATNLEDSPKRLPPNKSLLVVNIVQGRQALLLRCNATPELCAEDMIAVSAVNASTTMCPHHT